MPNDPRTALPPARNRRPSMIKGLIPTLPERGKIKIGTRGEMRKSARGTEFQPPQKLDHFVVTTLQRGDDGNFIPDETLMARLGDKPTEIPVRLLYDDPALNFPTRYACFVGRSLWCSGDGEVAIRAPATPTGQPQQVDCTCERADPAYKGNDKCKMNGSLSVLIEGAGGIGGVWKFRTTSYNSIVGIMSTLAFIRSMTGGVLANIPLKLKVQPKQAAAPDGNPVTIYVVSLEFDGDMPGLQEIAHGIALGRAKMNISIEHIEDEARRMLALAAPSHVPLAGDDANDVIEEFYPEQAVTEPEPPRGRDIKSGAAAEAFDPETGEFVDQDRIETEARAAAACGEIALQSFCKKLSDEEYKLIAPLVGAENTALRRIARDADAARLPPHSPAGMQPQTPRKDANGGQERPAPALSNSQPAGEPAIDDMLGGSSRPATDAEIQKHHIPLKRVPTDNEQNRWDDAVNAKLADGVDPALIIRDNAENIANLRKCDPPYYDDLMKRLGKKQ